MRWVHEPGDEPAGARAADPRGWADKRPPRILLAGLLGYVGATAAGVAQYSSGADAVAGYAILAAFCCCFLAVAVWVGRLYWLTWLWPLLGTMVALTLAEMFYAQGYAFYLAAVLVVPTVGRLGRRAAPLVVAAAIASLVVPWAVPSWHQGLGWGPAISIVFTALMAYAFTEIMSANRALRDAHDEIGRLASETERNRIARDLHDLLGHSLTAITVKAGLARRLASRDPQACAREVGEVEDLSRQALADVRAAVSNYREVTLASELARGKELLRAIGRHRRPADRDRRDRPDPRAAARLGRARGTHQHRPTRPRHPLHRDPHAISGGDRRQRRRRSRLMRERAHRASRTSRSRRRHRRGRPHQATRLAAARIARTGQHRAHMTVRLLLADDQELVRSALCALLDLEDDFEVVATVGRGDEVTQAAARAPA